MSSGNCSVDGCEHRAFSRGWCSTHYHRWWKSIQTQTCSVDHCERKVFSRGWCTAHYSRWYEYGDPVYRPALCAVDGCSRHARFEDWCERHYQRWLTYGDPVYRPPPKLRRARPTCSIEGCDRPHQARGWCEAHYHRWRAGYVVDSPIGPRGSLKRFTAEELRSRARKRAQQPEARAVRQEYYERNADYRSRMAKAYRRDKLSKIPNPRKGQPFTEAEDALVLRDDLSVIEICYMIGRRYQAVVNRRHKLRARERADC